MKQRKRNLTITIGVILIASLALVAFMLQPSAADLLTQALETGESITDGHAVVQFEVTMPDNDFSGTIEIWGQLNAGANGEPAFRMEILEASEPGAAGAVAVSDGSQLWIWHPETNTVFTATPEEMAEFLTEAMAEYEFDHQFNHELEGESPHGDHPETAEEAVAKLLTYVTAERMGSEDLWATSAHKIRMVPIPEQMPDEVRAAGGYINVWVGIDNKALLGAEYTESVLGIAGRVGATTMEFNQGVDAAQFTFEIPDGAQVVKLVDLMAAAAAEAAQPLPETFETLSPSELPEGAALVDESQVRGAVVQRYRLPDGSSFTVAQGPADTNYQPAEMGDPVTVRGVAGTLFADEDGSRALLSWTEGEVSFWIGGDLSADDLFAIADSLR